VRAGLVSDAAHYRWSSIHAHTTNSDEDDLEYSPERWLQVLRTSVDEEAEAERLRKSLCEDVRFATKSYTNN
jgi:hypothetical protein